MTFGRISANDIGFTHEKTHDGPAQNKSILVVYKDKEKTQKIAEVDLVLFLAETEKYL